MPGKKTPFDIVRPLAMQLSGTTESTAWGSPAFKVDGQWFVVVPTNKTAEPRSLAIRVDFMQRAELLESAPDVYYLAEHYQNYPTVLVRMDRVNPDALKGLLKMAWLSAKKKRK
jgi:hypothetical protein